MILDPALFGAFLAATIAITLLPGPDMLFVTAQCLQHGRRGGVLAVAGITTGLACHGIAASLGLSALFRWAPLAYDAVRWAGIAYLLWLAWQVFRAPNGTPDWATGDGVRRAGWRIFRDALVTNLLNPKIIVFFVAFLPQFVPAKSPHPGAAMLLHASLFILVGLAFYAVLTSTVGRLGDWLRATPRFWRVQRLVTGTTLGGMALWLMLPDRR